MDFVSHAHAIVPPVRENRAAIYLADGDRVQWIASCDDGTLSFHLT